MMVLEGWGVSYDRGIPVCDDIKMAPVQQVDGLTACEQSIYLFIHVYSSSTGLPRS